MNHNDRFEQALRDALDGYEVPYNSADWAQLEQRMAKGDGRASRWSAGLLALLIGGGLAVATLAYLAIAGPGQSGHGEEQLAAAPLASTGGDQGPAAERAPVQAEDAPEPLAPAPASAAAAAPATSETKGKATAMAPVGMRPAIAGPAPEPQQREAAAAAKPASSSSDIGIRPSVTEGCPGTSVTFEVSTPPEPGTRMLWNFGDGSFSTDPTPKHAYNKAGRYEVTLSMSSPSGGTIFNKPVSDVIVIHERPEAAFNPMPQEYMDRVPSVHFENKSLRGATYSWDFGDGHTSTAQVPTHVYKKKGDYTVSLVVTNAIGCTDRAERLVRIKEDYNLLAAPAFSPNGDGVEEHFIPEALKTLNRRFRMTIHDPSTGALVYETADVKRPWNGRMLGTGAPCPTGDYVWMVEMKDGEALGGTYNGTVSLLR